MKTFNYDHIEKFNDREYLIRKKKSNHGANDLSDFRADLSFFRITFQNIHTLR